jgi:hypothetical protein
MTTGRTNPAMLSSDARASGLGQAAPPAGGRGTDSHGHMELLSTRLRADGLTLGYRRIPSQAASWSRIPASASRARREHRRNPSAPGIQANSRPVTGQGQGRRICPDMMRAPNPPRASRCRANCRTNPKAAEILENGDHARPHQPGDAGRRCPRPADACTSRPKDQGTMVQAWLRPPIRAIERGYTCPDETVLAETPIEPERRRNPGQFE